MAVVVAACGGSTATSSAPAAAVGRRAEPARAGGLGARPANRPRPAPPATPARRSTIKYSIWGDPQEIASQKAIADAFHAANPNITVDVDVSDWDAYWDKLQTGLAGGAAPGRVRDGRPAVPRLPGARRAARPQAATSTSDGYDLTQLADQGVADFTTADGGQYGLPRDLNTIVLYYNKAMFDAAGIPYPDDTWDWAKLVEVAKQLTKDDNGDGKADQWGFYTETTDMENFWLSTGVAERRRHPRAGRQDHRARHRPGRRRHPVPPGPDLEGQGHARSRRSRPRPATRSSRARPPWRPTARGWCRRSTAAGHQLRRSRRCPRARPAGSRRSTRPARSSTRARRPRTPPGSS